MQILKTLVQAIVAFGHRVNGFGDAMLTATKQRRAQGVLDKAEAERIDRIRNPSDYIGK